MIRFLATALCVIALPVAAQSAYKCTDAKSGTVYQSTPCAAGAEQKRWSTAAPAAGSGEQGRQAADMRTRNATAKGDTEPSMGAQMITWSGQPSPEACTRAKRVRASALADASMKNEREFHDTLQRNVENACK